jgi:hypothetical protein
VYLFLRNDLSYLVGREHLHAQLGNGKTRFEISNVPEEAILLRYNELFAYVYEALSRGKGMMKLQILPGKNQTIASVLHETYPVLKCFDNEKLALISPQTVAYIRALIIDSISIQSEDTINTLAFEHESTMLNAYTKMETDSFKSQLRTVLTAYYQDIKVTGASGGSKSKVVKR